MDSTSFSTRAFAAAIQYYHQPEAVERERMLCLFKAHHLYRRYEPFYLAYPDRMKK